MQAGALRHVVYIDGPPFIRTPDGEGGYAEAPTTIGPVHAAVMPATAADIERRSQVQVQGQITHRVRLRYVPGVTVTSVVRFADPSVFGAIALNVKGITNIDMRNTELELSCEERV